MAPSVTSRSGEFARFLQSGRSSAARLQRGVDLAVELVEGCHHAGVTIVDRGGAWSAAVSDEVVQRGDALQYELGEGPCLDSVRAQHTVISQDLTDDRRWPRWAPQVVSELGVHGMMSLLLFTDRDTLGALNLYADQVDAWDGAAMAVGHALADQLAAAVADSREIENRELAMTGRTTIGQAQGILMERFGIDSQQAFDYLRRISQDSNRKLVDLAAEIVSTRHLPGHSPIGDD